MNLLQLSLISSLHSPIAIQKPALITKQINLRMLRNILRVNNCTITRLINIYEDTIKAQNMTRDQKQITVIHDLQKLNDDLVSTHLEWKKYANLLSQEKPYHYNIPNQGSFTQKKQQKKRGFFDFFSQQFSTSRSLRVKGLYLYGSSGCGKSFLSDIFYKNLPIEQKKKMHFHEFMASIHAELFLLQKEKKGYDPLTVVAQRTAKKIRLLYLDQFQVVDVADATILRRLFQRLINNELVLLATTNRPPDDLYKDGHQRQFFIPFIEFIKEECVIRDIDSAKDYRYELQRDDSQKFKTYISPINQKSEQDLKKVISALTGQLNPYFTQAIVQPILGRKLKIPRSCNRICVYKFSQLIESTMGDSDFRAICKNFKAIVVRDMRKINRHERNLANRLIKLFDEAYFRNVKIYIQASVDIDHLIDPVAEADASTQQDFAMIRCKSRLMQFQTINYKQKLSYIQQQQQKADSAKKAQQQK